MVGHSRSILLLLCSVWTYTRADRDIACVFMTGCILPCQFQPGAETVIHWIQDGNFPVHVFYHDKDQLSRQNPRFKNRTSLFNNEISKGNASLRLTGLQIQDEGRYECYTSTNPGVRNESLINLRVDAPVRKVNVVREDNVVTCSSEGIYPEPELTWSNLTKQHEPTVQRDDQLLYSINSSVTLTDADDNLDYYSCSVTTKRGSSFKTTLFKTADRNVSESEYTVTCGAVNIKPPSQFTWTFNFSEVVATGHDGQYTAVQPWDQWVKNVSESGDLTLRDLPADRTGVYTCEVSDARETFIYGTFLRIQTEKSPKEEERKAVQIAVQIAVPIVIAVVVVVVVVVIVIFVILPKCKNRRRRTPQRVSEEVPMSEIQSKERAPMMNGHPVD